MDCWNMPQIVLAIVLGVASVPVLMALGVLFLEGRLYFHHVCGRRASANAGAPSVLVAYGAANAECLKACTLAGRYVAL